MFGRGVILHSRRKPKGLVDWKSLDGGEASRKLLALSGEPRSPTEGLFCCVRRPAATPPCACKIFANTLVMYVGRASRSLAPYGPQQSPKRPAPLEAAGRRPTSLDPPFSFGGTAMAKAVSYPAYLEVCKGEGAFAFVRRLRRYWCRSICKNGLSIGAPSSVRDGRASISALCRPRRRAFSPPIRSSRPLALPRSRQRFLFAPAH